jgi:hypothetical protein
MSQRYREEKVQQFRNGEIWGLICMDAFGLVSDSTTRLVDNLLTSLSGHGCRRCGHRSPI